MATDLDKECLFSGLPMATCAHCRHDEDLTINEQDEYEVTGIIESQFNSRCTLDPDHKIRRGDRVAFLQRADNPLLPVRGVACRSCFMDLPRARR